MSDSAECISTAEVGKKGTELERKKVEDMLAKCDCIPVGEDDTEFQERLGDLLALISPESDRPDFRAGTVERLDIESIRRGEAVGLLLTSLESGDVAGLIVKQDESAGARIMERIANSSSVNDGSYDKINTSIPLRDIREIAYSSLHPTTKGVAQTWSKAGKAVFVELVKGVVKMAKETGRGVVIGPFGKQRSNLESKPEGGQTFTPPYEGVTLLSKFVGYDGHWYEKDKKPADYYNAYYGFPPDGFMSSSSVAVTDNTTSGTCAGDFPTFAITCPTE